MDRSTSRLWRHFCAHLHETEAPPYAHRSLAKLPAVELTRFGRAWRLLGKYHIGGAGSVIALAREGDMTLAGAGICEALLARSWEARHRSARQMLHLAVAAQEVAAELKVSDLGSAVVADLQARTWGELANAYRVAGLDDEALAAFGDAFDRFAAGSRDPLLKSHLSELEAAHVASGNPEAALDRLSSSLDLYRYLGESHLAGRVRITQSIYMARSGKPEEALRLSAEGLAQIDRRREPLLLKTALHNRLLLLLNLGRREEAGKMLAQCRLGFQELC
ncbi:MAG TPA: hypothetical protein VE078_14875, partial [Thermoanaerobaculia bacterium]|nr:hypothetical protein [Thermoanaerobaculia bacterium]